MTLFLGRPVKALVVDYGGTLATFTRPQAHLVDAYQAIATRVSAEVDIVCPPDVLLTEVHDRVEARLERVRDNATTAADPTSLVEADITTLHREAYAAIGISLTAAQVDPLIRIEQEAWWCGVDVSEPTRATLVRLRTAGMRVGLCSNAPYPLHSMLGQLKFLGLDTLFDGATFSTQVGKVKPAADMFHAALATLGCAPADAVMVGDSGREDIAGARAVGMRTIRTREFIDNPDPIEADAVLDTFSDLLSVLGIH